MKAVFGLGNPEKKYVGTRHNLGFAAMEEFRKKLNLPDWSYEDKFKSEVASIVAHGLVLVRPQTYMNQSGLAVKLVANYYKIPATDIVIVHDDLDLPLGKIKVRMGGGAGGHHGVGSVINSLGTDQFIRLKLGIGNEESHSGEYNRISFNAEKFVLEPFLPNERSQVNKLLKKAVEALQILITEGLEKAQNRFH